MQSIQLLAQDIIVYMYIVMEEKVNVYYSINSVELLFLGEGLQCNIPWLNYAAAIYMCTQ